MARAVLIGLGDHWVWPSAGPALVLITATGIFTHPAVGLPPVGEQLKAMVEPAHDIAVVGGGVRPTTPGCCVEDKDLAASVMVKVRDALVPHQAQRHLRGDCAAAVGKPHLDLCRGYAVLGSPDRDQVRSAVPVDITAP